MYYYMNCIYIYALCACEKGNIHIYIYIYIYPSYVVVCRRHSQRVGDCRSLTGCCSIHLPASCQPSGLVPVTYRCGDAPIRESKNVFSADEGLVTRLYTSSVCANTELLGASTLRQGANYSILTKKSEKNKSLEMNQK